MFQKSKRKSAVALLVTAVAVSAFTGAPAEAAGRDTSVRGASLYKDPSNPSSNDPSLSRITNAPTSRWLVGSDASGLVAKDVAGARSSGDVPVFVAYNIPNRDCGSYSGGGVNDAGSYSAWIGGIAGSIGGARAAVILEPDALSNFTCLDDGARWARLGMLRDAVGIFASQAPNTAVYLDAGHSNWNSPSEMADRLRNAGVSNARGFAVNVASFNATSDEQSYASQISNQLGGAGYIIDTSRNGNGPTNGEWCNPWGRALGESPTTSTGNGADAYLWVKRPGESDGYCNGGPAAGQWWEDYARGLINN